MGKRCRYELQRSEGPNQPFSTLKQLRTKLEAYQAWSEITDVHTSAGFYGVGTGGSQWRIFDLLASAVPSYNSKSY